jgi:hypothetical protein
VYKEVLKGCKSKGGGSEVRKSEKIEIFWKVVKSVRMIGNGVLGMFKWFLEGFG